MIRISTRTGPGQRITLQVEGRLTAANVATLVDAFATVSDQGVPIRLDLSGVTYLDAAGARALAEIRATGAELAGCSGLVQELLS